MAEYGIILKDDKVNSFKHVIDCLVEFCGHQPLQAEQCALLVHYKGSYKVKRFPDFESTEDAFINLQHNGLQVEYERID